MQTIATATRPVALWRDIICPKEHGSWSLAFEPLALGLLVAPSVPGALLGITLGAAFFARRPLRLAMLERRPERRAPAWRALGLCSAIALGGLAGAIALEGVAWLAWLAPAALAGAVFAFFDARGEGREEIAELAGATAFALTPIALAILGGVAVPQAIALGVLMTARAAPSVACVRAFLRAAKTGVRRDAPALIAAVGGLLAGCWLVRAGIAPRFAAVALAVFAVRTLALLVLLRPAWRARTLGMIETVLGVGFVVGLAATWLP